MRADSVKVSGRFRTLTIQSVLTIILFIAVYIALVAGAVWLLGLCGKLAIGLLKLRLSLGTGLIALGIVALGAMVLFFLVKFLFAQNRTDTSDMIEVTAEEEPKLFELIHEVVSEVKTRFPKKVFLTPNVNAAVFYNSSFWSMFFPVRKNLMIGVGLMNSLTTSEFKGVIAHEFGHFSQRSMKLGSYVYQANKIIYNMLYENSSFNSLLQSTASIDGIISFFVMISVQIVRLIQWILTGVYALLNRVYMGLSREMEFHADAVAANVTGSAPLSHALLRLNLADNAYQSVIEFYNNKTEPRATTGNIYPQQYFIMNLVAQEHAIALQNGFPNITPALYNKYNKSKLVIKDQWASHPSTEDRIAALTALNIPAPVNDTRPALSLLQSAETTGEQVTRHFFAEAGFPGDAHLFSFENFRKDFTANRSQEQFPALFNGYYNRHNFDAACRELPGVTLPEGTTAQALYDAAHTDTLYTVVAMEYDLNLLQQLAGGGHSIKSFDYDGKKYRVSKAGELAEQLKQQLEAARQQLTEHDAQVYRYFRSRAETKGRVAELDAAFDHYFHTDKQFDRLVPASTELYTAMEFTGNQLPFDQIRANLAEAQKREPAFRQAVKEMLEIQSFQPELEPEIRASLEEYLNSAFEYFHDTQYYENELRVLFTALQNFQQTLSKNYLREKRQLLELLAELEG